MKKLTALVLVIVTLLSLVACGGGSNLYTADGIKGKMEKKGYTVTVIADKEEILSELEDMAGQDFPVPTAMITGEKEDDELAIMLFASEKDAKTFKKAFEDIIQKTVEQLGALMGEEAVQEMMGEVALTADKNALYQTSTAAAVKAVLG